MTARFTLFFQHSLTASLILLLATPAFAQDAEPAGGLVKTMIGWIITLVGIGAGIAVVVRPSSRKEPKVKK